ncbi:MAG TPA: CarD family transcriptional regulator, partial [Flavobacteriales bacterium]|nr:CarD family transcriptional regulator [Flavobacteriales bacterium]
MSTTSLSVTSITDLLALYRTDARVAQIAEGLQTPAARVQISGTIGSAQALIAHSVIEQRGGVHVFVLTDKEEAAYFINDLEALRNVREGEGARVREKKHDDMFFYPAPSRSPYDPEGHHDGERVSRTEVLEELMRVNGEWRKANGAEAHSPFANSHSPFTKDLVIITYPDALIPLVMGKEDMAKNTLTVKRHEDLPIDTLEEWLHETGFVRVEFVYEPGQYSIRGGIVDVFSYGSDKPYRIELYGDTVESVRRFDPQDQLTVEFLAEAVIVPDLQDEDTARQQTFFAQLPEDTVLWLRDLQAIGDAATKQLKLLGEAYEKLPEREKHPAPNELLATDSELIKGSLGFRKVFWGSSVHHRGTEDTENTSTATAQRRNGNATQDSKAQVAVNFQHRPQPAFAKEFKVLAGDLHNKRNAGYTNLIACNSAKQSERLHAIFTDMEGGDAALGNSSFTPLMLDLHEGFIDPELKLALYTDHQIFERYHRFRLKEGFRKNAQALTLKELTQLKPGDLVVHIDHGIGVFSGLETIDAGGSKQEAIRLKYRDNDILYVSIHSLHRVSKYSGGEGDKAPQVSKLGTPAWKNLKEKTKAKVKALAFDLIKLYAQRKDKPGHAFAPDTYLQAELEASFIYEDTPDQEKATLDVKRDMEKPVPMDRLVCGDVGFGKTEVAIRAAFKAATDGKQVAVLVPTTILALQHYKTFRDRMKDLPVRVDYINRFRSSKD